LTAFKNAESQFICHLKDGSFPAPVLIYKFLVEGIGDYLVTLNQRFWDY
jgi:hypothetical protein